MTVNVLADRHHAGLYRSLQLLGARLGWDLYTPVGLEWEQERYWAFGMNQPGLTEQLAQQYLVPHEGVWTWEAGWGNYRTTDPEFPGAPIVGVTLPTARDMRWDLVIATLDDNQWGFSRFAREHGAKFVVQAGNTNQYVAWNLDPLAIVSSEIHIHGLGVYYRQEMDPAATAWSEPSVGFASRRIRSFVNCFPSIGQCYDGWREMQLLVPGLGFHEFGIDGRDGVVKPIGTLAQYMASSLFGYHCKPHGDGFGHVIHGWAAVGRPLIGQSSHYAGKMAEVFWRHGETCIDLDRVSLPEAATMIRAIAADQDRHAEMCHAIRRVFDAVYDPAGDAERIRALLG